MNKYILLLVLLLIFLPLFSVEFGGHITQNTVWYPQHNPYIINSFLYVDSNVTLTIMPGTEILVYGGVTTDPHHFMWGGLNNDNEPVAKKIIVNGTINAIGTPDNPIIFDKYQDDSDYRWGGIYFTSNAPISTFEYCEINNGFTCDYEAYQQAFATLTFGNGLINVSNCSFNDNYVAISTNNLIMDLVIYKCSFYTNDVYLPPFVTPESIDIGTSVENPPDEDYDLVIARCYFTGNASSIYLIGAVKALFLFSVYDNLVSKEEPDKTIEWDYASVSSYGNYAYNGTIGWGCWSSDSTDVAFARKNMLVNTYIANHPMNLDSGGFGTNYVSDNYLLGNTQITATATEGNDSYIYNNIIETTYPGSSTLEFERQSTSSTGGQIRFFNNLVRYTGTTPPAPQLVTSRYTSPFIYNNTFINYHTLLNGFGDSQPVFTNNIIDVSYNYGGNSSGYVTSFINNCSILPIMDLPEYYYIENHLYSDPLFADTLNGDYSLSASSPCRDAGAYREDLPDFDIGYHKRIFSTNSDMPAVVDIGAYEYASAYIGGLRGNVYDASTNQALDCVKIEIMNKLPEFSDTLGNYTYHCGAGTYTVKASRWDYQDLIISDVTVMEVLELNLDIPMLPLSVSNHDEDILPTTESAFGLRNYPNPFNPETQISFIVAKAGKGELSIFNLKGQRVRTLYHGLLNSGYHSFVWDGKNNAGDLTSSGMYFIKIEVEGKFQTHKIVLMK